MNLEFFIIINLFIKLVSSSHLIVFRENPILSNISDSHSQQESRRLICISDRPKDAIVWNINLKWFKKDHGKSELAVPELSRFQIDYEQQCKFNVDDKECFSSWSQKGGKWSIVHSYDVPMGPVYDSRWENFTEFESTKFKPIKIMKNDVKSTLEFGANGSFTFSVIGSEHAQIMICESEKYNSDFCYWIIIGGWKHPTTVLKKCETGIEPLSVSSSNSSCRPTPSKYDQDPLLPLKWKTFVLTWEEKTRTIKLFDPDKNILSYSDHNSTYRNSNKSYHIFYGNLFEKAWFRFHDYSYTLTTDRGAILHSSPLILDNSQELCIDMMVGLCKHCELIVNIVSGTGTSHMIKRIRRSSKYDSIEHDLPMWQSEIIKAVNISNYPTPVRLELVASVISEETDTTKDHWAVRNLEKCLPEGTVKFVKITTFQECTANKCSWAADTNCQRLSYDDSKSEIVEDLYSSFSNSFLDDFYYYKICPNYNIGPNCSIKCDSLFQHDCYGVKACTKKGCSCAQGWQGSNCTTKCLAGTYGFECSKRCSSCIDDSCHSYSGKCDLGCISIRPNFFVPPYCNTVLGPPSILVDEVKETSARAFLYEEEMYTPINATFEFTAKTKSRNILSKYAQKAEVFFAGTEKVLHYAILDGLSPGEEYSVEVIIHIQLEDYKVKQGLGYSNSFKTLCNWSKKFKVKPNVGGLLIEKISEKESYPCPDAWYSVDLSIVLPTLNLLHPVYISNIETKFPIILSKLHPFEKYQVCINGKDKQFRTCQTSSTLEAVHSSAANLQVKSITSTKAELIWSFPHQPNDIILGYNLTIKVLYYKGCENKKNTPENLKITKRYQNIAPTTEVSYNSTDLVPYVTYEITVIAFNANISNRKCLTFSTKPRDIPTEVFTNLSLSHNNLTWDNSVDCWTITGPIEGARVIITGVSEDVKNFSHSYDTKSRHLNLNTLKMYGNEKYQAKVYVLRELDKSINTTAYIDIHFTTDPSPPPKVQNLQIVEVDELTTTLRWQQPLPPINGVLDYFSIRLLGKNETLLIEIKVDPNETCYLWKNSFCKTVPHPFYVIKNLIEVRAHNKGVNNPGESFIIDDNREEQVPEAPKIISITEVDKGVVYLKWKHPSITGGPMKKFIILSQMLDTKLDRIPSGNIKAVKVVPIHKYETEYSTYLYLLPSTRYGIFIHGATSTLSGKLSTQTIETNSALDFQYKPRPLLGIGTPLIDIAIPPVINNTKDSRLHVIVKGPSMCKQGGRLNERMMEDIKVENYEEAWHVATFPTYETTNMLFTIGDDHIYDTVRNCRLNAGSSYVIILLVHEKVQLNRNRKVRSLIWQSQSIQIVEFLKTHYASWTVPLILALLCIAAITYYCLRKRRNKKYLDKKQSNGETDCIPIHPITPEEKNKSSEHSNRREGDISKMVNVQNSILETLSNSTKPIYETIDTESKYDDASDTVDVQNSTPKTLLNSSERINGTIATESKYDDVSDTVDVRRSNSKILPNSSKHINTTATQPIYLEIIDTIETIQENFEDN